MTRKLTLSVDAEVIRKAKRAARQRGTSVSRMVQTYLELVSRTPGAGDDPPVLRRLRGSLKGVSVGDYRRYLREKYR
ncbi:MAG TPA: DUF6364 family protein [Thermoanaerobaculia bacterium]|jgi:hypothetical protein|nr:DUF6364 family protein [Thermoanaerobaculia bacterium]